MEAQLAKALGEREPIARFLGSFEAICPLRMWRTILGLFWVSWERSYSDLKVELAFGAASSDDGDLDLSDMSFV